MSIAVDAAGNVYTVGYFQGTVDFDPGAGVHNLTAVGPYDVFISKLDASGAFVWAKQMGGAAGSIGTSIALDAAGNIYTTGYFFGVGDFDPGAGVHNLTSAGNNDIFVSKLDASGNFVWAKNIGGTGDERAYSIAVDMAGNVYTTGYFKSTSDFDPGAGTYNLTPLGGEDIFVSKLDPSGNFVWADGMDGTNDERGWAVAVDAVGNVYTTGTFYGTVDFDPGVGVNNLVSAGSNDMFITKLNTSGALVWAKRIGGAAGDEIGRAIAIDGGNVYTTGEFNGTVDFDPGAGVFNLTSAGNADMFVSKLDTSGTFIWAKSIGGISTDAGYGIAVDGAGNVYTTGRFSDTVDFDPGAGTFHLMSAGLDDIFVSKLDASGNFVWAGRMGGTSIDEGNSIAVDAGGGCVYATGDFVSTPADFDPGTSVFNLTSAGSADIFVLKLCSASLNIEESCIKAPSVTVFPNPSHGFFSIKSETKISNIDIVNVLGEKIYSNKVNANEIELELNKEAKGIYFMRITYSDKSVINKKIIIQ
jgi:hypothetical protein